LGYACSPSSAFKRPAIQSWIEGSIKSGKTVSCMAWLFGQALFKGKPGRQFWWITPVFAQAKIAYGRMKRGYPATHTLERYRTNQLSRKGAIISFKSGEKPDNLYGEDV
jgi:hypothetical protein